MEASLAAPPPPPLPPPYCSAYHRTGCWWARTEAISRAPVACRPQLATLGSESYLPSVCSPRAQTPACWSSALSAPLSQSHKNAAVGSQGQVAREDSTKTPYLRWVLVCFVVAICRCPSTKASATDQLQGEMAWPRARGPRQVVGPWRLPHAMGR